MDAEKFWSKIRQDDNGCWIWTGRKDGKGYGRVDNTVAHRISWLFTNGSLPPNLYVCHKCDVPLCVNPSHLFLGTALDNTQDAISKGRFRTPAAFARGRCARGHELTGINLETFKRKSGETERVCRLCRLERRYRHERKVREQRNETTT